MVILRTIGSVLPQILLLLLLGGTLDLLGGWNHTDTATGVLLVLFLLNPIVTSILLIVETVKYRRQKKSGNGTPSFLMPGLAIFYFVEALGTDVVILSQLRMN